VIVVDTTMLVYAVGGDHPLRRPSADLFEAVRSGRIVASTTAEVIQEFVHVRTRRHGREEAVARGRDWLEGLSPLLPMDGRDLELALDLYRRHPLDAFDSLLAATALRHETAALVSADRAFGGIPGLTHIAPGTPAFDEFLAS
jgi:predicted nucleic acid-binding protein